MAETLGMRPDDLRRMMRPEELISWLGRPRRLYDLVVSGHVVVTFQALEQCCGMGEVERAIDRSSP